jgi:predicted ATPase
LTQLFAEITLNRTAVIFLEDIHWADQGSLDFLKHLMNTRPDLPILIVALMRSTLFEQQPDWGSGPVQSLRMDLLPLSDENCRRLVVEILQKVPVIPPALVDLIVEKAEGSPFYLEELIKVLIDKGIILRGDEQWQVELERLSDLQVPATLTGLLQARLDILSANVRETLQQASVVGRIFWTQVVGNMKNPETHPVGVTSSPVLDRLKELKAKELIFPYGDLTSPKIPEFIFKNAILHNVTYESVLLRLRPVYHLQVAEGLIEISGERVTEYAGRVGEHYEQAQELLQAAYWYSRAGRQAQVTYTPDTAIEYFQKALRFLEETAHSDQTAQQLEIYSWLGEVLSWKARYTEAADSYKKMLTLAKTNGDVIAQCRALQGLATSLSDQGDQRTALLSAVEAESLAREANAPAEIAKALWVQGTARYRLGEPRVVLTLAEQSLSITTQLNNRNEMGKCLNLLGAAHYVLGEYSPAQNYWESALKIFRELGNRQQDMVLLSNLGVVADARGDYQSAYRLYHQALEVAREIGNQAGEIYILSNCGIELVALKNFAAAEADLRHVIRLKGMTGSWFLANTYNYYAEALLGLERVEEATFAAQQGLAQSIEDGSTENIGGAWRALGLIAGKTRKTISVWDRQTGQKIEYEASACFEKSEKIFAEAEIHGERARSLREWAIYEFGRGHQERGIQLWEEARAIFEKLGAQKWVERMSDLPS